MATANNDTLLPLDTTTATTASNGSSLATSTVALPPRQRSKVKRRVVRKAFYSDEEDESSEEEVDPYYPNTNGNVAATLKEPTLLGTPSTVSDGFFKDDVNATTNNGDQDNFGWKSNGTTAMVELDDEDSDLNEDHKLLLDSSLPLLKSRNSAVVLAACSLHYHCGVASIKVSSTTASVLLSRNH